MSERICRMKGDKNKLDMNTLLPMYYPLILVFKRKHSINLMHLKVRKESVFSLRPFRAVGP